MNTTARSICTARSISALAFLLGLTVAACGPSAAGSTSTPAASSPAASSPASVTPVGSPSPSLGATPGSSPSPIVVGQVTSAAQAAALVLASNPLFAEMTPLRSDVVGRSAWYEASGAIGGFAVSVTMGSGDCESGCISRHTWNYLVATDGTIELVSEQGDEIEVSPPVGTADPATVNVTLVAGPVCPVERVPPDPNCAPRPVVNAEAVLRDPSGAEVGRGTSDADGRIVFNVPGGAYYVEPQPVEGIMGLAEPVALAVVGGSSAGLVLEYDTGIR